MRLQVFSIVMLTTRRLMQIARSDQIGEASRTNCRRASTAIS